MALPFREEALLPPGFLQRILGRKPPLNAIRELNNIFARAKSIRDVPANASETIAARYNRNLFRSHKTELETLYKLYLTHCLTDRELTDAEIEDLGHLKRLLGLNDNGVGRIHEVISGVIYRKSLDDVIADGRLDEQERLFLEKLRSNLRLPEHFAKKLYASGTQEFIQRFMDTATSDQRLSPDEEEELKTLGKNFGATLAFNETTRSTLDKFRLFWLIENGEVPTVQPGITLQRNEHCYYTGPTVLHELRTVTQRINYSAVTARVRLFQGVYWRVGSIAPSRITKEMMTLIDSGTMYLTTKRVIFTGTKKNSNIQLKKILDFKVYKDGVEIVKETGRNAFFSIEGDTEVFAMLLGRAIKDLP